jgi:uridylate kinase
MSQLTQNGLGVNFTHRDIKLADLASADYEVPFLTNPEGGDVKPVYVQPAAGAVDVLIKVLTYTQFINDKKVVVDANAITLTRSTWIETPVVKIYSGAGAVEIGLI